MTTKRGGSRPRLTFEQANAICREFVPAGEHIFDYMDRLRAAGFEAFVPRQEFIQSFCADPEEARMHRECQVEFAKIRLGRLSYWRMTPEQEAQLYMSPLLRRLIAKRDARNGVPETELGNRYPGEIWRGELDPCHSRKRYSAVREKRFYEPRWQAMFDEERRLFEEEGARHGSGLARGHTFEKRGRYAFCKLAMERTLAPLGFHFDAAKSFPDYPVFTKRISVPWDLCWVMETQTSLFLNAFEGNFEPELQVRGEKFRGSSEKGEINEILIIEFQHVIRDFGVAYWKFFDLDQLETAIMAHAFLYGLMAPVIEDGLHKVLGDDSFKSPC